MFCSTVRFCAPGVILDHLKILLGHDFTTEKRFTRWCGGEINPGKFWQLNTDVVKLT